MQQGDEQRSDNLNKGDEERPRLLVVLTGADQWTLADGTSHPTGFWAEELVEPMRVFRDAGVDMTVATPRGVAPTVDEASLSAEGAGGEDRAVELRAALDALSDMLAAPAAPEDISPADFEGVFVPGGHGPMEDLAASPELGRLLITMLDDGSWAFSGRELSAFTSEEETQAGLAGKAPWLLEDRLREAGGTVATAPAWQPFSIVDGNVVTGQNPGSSTEVAQRTVERLRARAHFVHVVPHHGTWSYKHEHSEPQGDFPTKKAATRAAMEHARAHGDWEIILHDRHGRIQDSQAVRPGG